MTHGHICGIMVVQIELREKYIMTEEQAVAKMIELIRSEGGTSACKKSSDGGANYMFGYLQSMMVAMAIKCPEVLEEVNTTIDWIEAKV